MNPSPSPGYATVCAASFHNLAKSHVCACISFGRIWITNGHKTQGGGGVMAALRRQLYHKALFKIRLLGTGGRFLNVMSEVVTDTTACSCLGLFSSFSPSAISVINNLHGSVPELLLFIVYISDVWS